MRIPNLSRHYERLNPWERVRLRLAAGARKDDVEEQRLFEHSPTRIVPIPTHLQNEVVLHTFSLMYLTEQLESIASFFFARMQFMEGHIKDADLLSDLAGMAGANAYCFQKRMLGWKRFCRSIGLESDTLLSGNYSGLMLEAFDGKVQDVAPTPEVLIDWFQSRGLSPGTLIDEESEYRSWRGLLEKATTDAPLFEEQVKCGKA